MRYNKKTSKMDFKKSTIVRLNGKSMKNPLFPTTIQQETTSVTTITSRV
jgi:hypothetical protein